MALVKFGAGVSEMRGKEGGVIYSRNRYGAYMKTKISPTNPQTSPQQTQRALMGNLAQLWKTLASGEKAAWENLGAQTSRVNRFGDQTDYAGFGIFMRLNRNLSIIGESALTVAPVPPTFPELSLVSVVATVSTTTIAVNFTPSPLAAGKWIVVYCTNNILTGRKFVKNFYRLILVEDNAGTGVDIYPEWNAYFGNVLLADAALFVKVKVIDEATGFDTVPDSIDTVVLATP